ncbi:MAG TPA: tannase/feruloyl esterase family alpha/beta hydrolase, partial [Bryobacteraceae bacterium]|nr:tannase/feruloyl esterase family alpha/beta hydrolase [Bryobacteraceae bacterium]
SYIPPAKYPVIHNAVLAACDALDGVKNGVIEQPEHCHFDPKTIECKGADAPDCLTAPQVEAARKIYSGPINPRTKQQIFPGLMPGSELRWGTQAGPRVFGPGADMFKYVIFDDPNWDYKTLNFDSDIAKAEKIENNIMNATDPNLKPYFQRGGKLLQYQGWADQQVSSGNSPKYYKSVVKKLGGPSKVRNSYRLFMVPGMGHCGGGEGTSTFDMLGVMEKWIQTKKAPDEIVASRMEDGKVVRTHPLCPYPQQAVYRGSGSTDDAANFSCKAK